ncbi:MAG: hypothetical protein JNM07_11550 [Phycisphaerae bacterium]|nr:hypothetical protein [Phycisphaerae bacterium]
MALAPTMSDNRINPMPHPATSSRPLRACVILAGGLKLSPLTEACGLSVLDLPLTERQTVFSVWLSRLDAVRQPEDVLPVRVIFGDNYPPPRSRPQFASIRLEVSAEPQHYRGPAGVARDVLADIGPDELVLIAEANRYCGAPLQDLIRSHLASGADVTIAANPDGTPAGLYLMARRCLDLVPAAGFMDLKEQFLSKVRTEGRVARVHALDPPGSVLIRTREQLLDAAATAKGIQGSDIEHFANIWPMQGESGEPSAFQVVCSGSLIDPQAVVADSIVMEGARVGPRAIVIRSVIGPNIEVRSAETVVDSIRFAPPIRARQSASPAGKERPTR